MLSPVGLSNQSIRNEDAKIANIKLTNFIKQAKNMLEDSKGTSIMS